MIGIVSYGGYIPRLRLNRMSIFQELVWYPPARLSSWSPRGNDLSATGMKTA